MQKTILRILIIGQNLVGRQSFGSRSIRSYANDGDIPPGCLADEGLHRGRLARCDDHALRSPIQSFVEDLDVTFAQMRIGAEIDTNGRRKWCSRFANAV